MKLARLGPQTACWQKARRNTVPSEARRSTFGVIILLWLYVRNSGRKSSETRYSTLGAAAAGALTIVIGDDAMVMMMATSVSRQEEEEEGVGG